jgi:nucleotide-binding universal stress UspA family protein
VLSKARRQASERGVEIGEELIAKRGVEALIEVADARDARLIVVGSFGESALKGIILGSTTNKLLHLTDRPVLVVPAEEE